MVVVTGTPGTGKSTFARTLALHIENPSVIEINDVARELGLYTGKTWHGSKEVDMKRLASAVKRRIGAAKGLAVVVGHLAPDLGIKCDIAVITRLSLKRLVVRLAARKYHAEKIRENIISEALDYCGLSMDGLASEIYEIEERSEYELVKRYITLRASGKKATAPKLKSHDKIRALAGMARSGNRYKL